MYVSSAGRLIYDFSKVTSAITMRLSAPQNTISPDSHFNSPPNKTGPNHISDDNFHVFDQMLSTYLREVSFISPLYVFGAFERIRREWSGNGRGV